MDRKEYLAFMDELITYRANHNLSMKAMAEKCNLNIQTIWLLETGRSKPSRLTVQKIKAVIEGDK